MFDKFKKFFTGDNEFSIISKYGHQSPDSIMFMTNQQLAQAIAKLNLNAYEDLIISTTPYSDNHRLYIKDGLEYDTMLARSWNIKGNKLARTMFFGDWSKN